MDCPSLSGMLCCNMHPSMVAATQRCSSVSRTVCAFPKIGAVMATTIMCRFVGWAALLGPLGALNNQAIEDYECSDFRQQNRRFKIYYTSTNMLIGKFVTRFRTNFYAGTVSVLTKTFVVMGSLTVLMARMRVLFVRHAPKTTVTAITIVGMLLVVFEYNHFFSMVW